MVYPDAWKIINGLDGLIVLNTCLQLQFVGFMKVIHANFNA